jgi:hypothetical protein
LPALGLDLGAAGFSDSVLTGVDPVLRTVLALPRLSVLSAGSDIGRAGGSYGGPRAHRVLEVLRRSADVVVIAAPPLTDPDGQALAIEADTVVLVAEIGSATFGGLTDALAEAQRVRASVLGVVAYQPAPPRTAAHGEPRKARQGGVTIIASQDPVPR